MSTYSVQDWLEWARARETKIDPAIIQYINKYKVGNKGVTTPTPRSWNDLSKAMKALDIKDHKELDLLARSFVGEIGGHFADYISKIKARSSRYRTK